MKTLNIFLIVMNLNFSLNLYAAGKDGNERGNSGDAVVCRSDDASILTAQTLDYQEAQTIYDIHPYLGDANTTVPGGISNDVIAKVRLAISRLPSFDTERRTQYTTWLMQFQNEMEIVPNICFDDIKDSLHSVNFKPCRIEQLAVQRREQILSGKRYRISQEIWDHLDADNQATLILHEIIYREAIMLGKTDSRHVRYFTAMLISNQLASLSAADYVIVLNKMGFPLPQECIPTGKQFDSGVWLDQSQEICFVKGSLKKTEVTLSGILARPQYLPYGFESIRHGHKTTAKATVYGPAEFYLATINLNSSFGASGREDWLLKQARLAADQTLFIYDINSHRRRRAEAEFAADDTVLFDAGVAIKNRINSEGGGIGRTPIIPGPIPELVEIMKQCEKIITTGVAALKFTHETEAGNVCSLTVTGYKIVADECVVTWRVLDADTTNSMDFSEIFSPNDTSVPRVFIESMEKSMIATNRSCK